MPWFFECAKLLTLLCHLNYLRDSHDGTTLAPAQGVLTTRPSRTWPLPITSPSVLETWIQTFPCLLGATIPSSPCTRICITVRPIPVWKAEFQSGRSARAARVMPILGELQ